jgi:hypothetical protein
MPHFAKSKLNISAFTIAATLLCGTAVHANETGQETIAFRMTDWKASHFNSSQEAQRHVDTLKQIGCEVAVEQHAGHVDVRARTGGWKSVTLSSCELCDQWEAFLKQAGFETLHGHSHTPTPGAIAVRFQLANWQSQHFNNDAQAAESATLFKALGCEVQQANHSGHMDLNVRCETARTLVCDSHDQAHALQNWLNQSGFQTQHAH